MDKRILSEEEQRVTGRCLAAWQAYKKKTGCNQTSMAEKLGFRVQSAFSQYINGVVPPNLGFVLSFASIIGVDPASLWPEKAGIIHQPPPPLAITLRLLEEHSGLNDTSLAEAINQKAGTELTTQTAIWRMRGGESKQPRDSTIEPIAAFFGLTVAQLKDVNYIKSLIDGGIVHDETYEILMQIYEGLAETDKQSLLDYAELLSLAAAHRNTHH
jgi:transcriptional regulator with XRE-family HTH domain